MKSMQRRQRMRLLLTAENVRVTGVEDSHGGATVELSAGSAQLNLQHVSVTSLRSRGKLLLRAS